MQTDLSTQSALNRRRFLHRSGVAIEATAWAGLSQVSPVAAAELWPPATHSAIRKGDVVVFQGDSITDAGRSREKAAVPNEQPGLGHGYAWFAAGELLVDRPGDSLTVYNRGVSGNKVFQLADRWQADCLDLKPNVLTDLPPSGWGF